MSHHRLITLMAIVATSANTLATTDNSVPAPGLQPLPQVGTVTGAASSILGRPTFGIRIGGGQWNEFMVNAGVDVTFKVPLLPLPQLRLDAEAWSKLGNYNDRRGNAISLLGMQTFLAGYAGFGPSYYFTNDNGIHKSGFGGKAVGGLTLPGSAFVEAGFIIGASPVPVFVTVGKRF